VHPPGRDVRTSYRPAAVGDAIPSGARKERPMEIGKPLRKIVVEPIRNPVPERAPKPAPDPAPTRPAPARVKT
jgi:hypothetical protein